MSGIFDIYADDELAVLCEERKTRLHDTRHRSGTSQKTKRELEAEISLISLEMAQRHRQARTVNLRRLCTQ
jgi:hypothetical protein